MRSRREFMGLAAPGAVALLAPRWLYAWAAEPDLIVVNAKVYTMDAAVPRAEAFAVKGGRFVAIGTSADIKALAGKKTQTFDAKQMTVVPGFTDCHNHAGGTTLLYEVLVGNPFEVDSSRSPASSRNSKPKPRPHRRARGSRATSSTTRSSRTSARSTFTISIRSRLSIPLLSVTAAATRRSTTAKSSSWRASRRTRQIPPMAHSIAIRPAH